LLNGGVTCKFKVLSSFNVSFRGQGAASKAHHCANTNVVANWVGYVDNDYQADNFWTTR
jgi:hypothetical protein